MKVYICHNMADYHKSTLNLKLCPVKYYVGLPKFLDPGLILNNCRYKMTCLVSVVKLFFCLFCRSELPPPGLSSGFPLTGREHGGSRS